MGFGDNNLISEEELAHLNKEKCATYGMFDELELYKYLTNEGEIIYREVVQFEPWSSGPMCFLAFERVSDGKLFSFWTEEEVRENGG
jgi:hypothetical protein